MNNKNFVILFSVIVIAELIFGSVESLQHLHYITKPLILIALIIYFVTNWKPLSNHLKYIVLSALVLSLVGDILLMFVEKSPKFFLFGLVSFLLAHIMYVLAFKTKWNSKQKPWLFITVLLLYALSLFYLMKNHLGEMLVPVIVYILVILTMAITAAFRKDNVSNKSYYWILVGALFFVISDSLLAVNKFYTPLSYSNISIIGTYALAQYCIVKGILQQAG